MLCVLKPPWAQTCLLREFGILREHTLPRLFYIRRVRIRTQLSTRVRPRYENRNFDLIAVLKKVNAPFNHDAHDARSLCADQQIVRSHLLHFLLWWHIKKNKRTIMQIAVQLPYKISSFCIGLYINMDAPTRLQNLSACITGC